VALGLLQNLCTPDYKNVIFDTVHCLRQIVDSVQRNIPVTFLCFIFLSKTIYKHDVKAFFSGTNLHKVKQVLNYGFMFQWRNNIRKLHVYMEPSFCHSTE
jgi:hypothetical protein